MRTPSADLDASFKGTDLLFKESPFFTLLYQALELTADTGLSNSLSSDSTKDRKKSTISFTSSNTWSKTRYSSKSKTCRRIDSSSSQWNRSHTIEFNYIEKNSSEKAKQTDLPQTAGQRMDSPQNPVSCQPLTDRRPKSLKKEEGYSDRPRSFFVNKVKGFFRLLRDIIWRKTAVAPTCAGLRLTTLS